MADAPEDAVKAAEKDAVDAAAQAALDAVKETPKTDDLGPGGQAALKAERDARKAAEKTAREAKAKLDALEAEKLSDVEKLEKRAADAEALASGATDKLRKANLMAALSEAGVQNVKAAVRLLDGVEFDDSDEPKNLDAAITAAKAEYGEALFKQSKPAAPNIDAGGGGGDQDRAPSLTAEELAMAKSFGMTPAEYAAAKDPGYAPEPEPAKT